MIKIFKNIIYIIITSAVIVMILFYLYFPIITNHGETITVPDLKGLNYDEIDDYLTQRNLKYEIIPDSSFTTDYPPLSVIFQNPIEGKKVKEGRKIYLTLNSIQPPKIKMPKLINGSVKNAQLILKTYDLFLGKINYVPDMAANAVIQQYHNGDIIQGGDLISKGSTIDLDIGNGMGNQIFEIPNLIGLDLEEGKFTILGSGLSIGEIYYKNEGKLFIDIINEDGGEEIKEINAKNGIIFKQYPESPKKIKIGRKIDMWVVRDSLAIK